MKSFFKILGIVLLVLCIACGVVAYKNRSNISGLVTAMRYSGDEIQTKLDNSSADLKGEISKYLDGDLRDFTEEEKQAIENRETTREEVLASIITEDAAKEKTSSLSPGSKTAEAKKPTSDEIVRKYTASLLALEGKYVGYIEGVLGSAVDKFYALPPSQRTYSAKMKVMQEYVGQINSLEAQCDGEVEAIISQLTKELKDINADTSIIKSIRKAYNNEKSLKKAYYINQYS